MAQPSDTTGACPAGPLGFRGRWIVVL